MENSSKETDLMPPLPEVIPDNLGRKDYLSWQEYFMCIAFLSSQRSKDPRTQVGACIVDEASNHIVGIGYNGFPVGCSDDKLPWNGGEGLESVKMEDYLQTKYAYACHAEMNAIMNRNALSISSNVAPTSIYVTMFPCNECAKLIVQAGIRKVVYYSEKYMTKVVGQGARIIFGLAGVEYKKYEGRTRFSIDFDNAVNTHNSLSK
ncbi:hypothetical protein ACOME3_007570 [Neoechinorhynchus agilis]